MEIFAISSDPVAGDVMLSGRQIHISLAYHEMQAILQLILDVGVPYGVPIELWPQISDIGGAPKFWGNQVADLIGIGPRGTTPYSSKTFRFRETGTAGISLAFAVPQT
jgi:hypothetical protein